MFKVLNHILSSIVQKKLTRASAGTSFVLPHFGRVDFGAFLGQRIELDWASFIVRKNHKVFNGFHLITIERA